MIDIAVRIFGCIAIIWFGIECFLHKPNKKVSGIIFLNGALGQIFMLIFSDKNWFLNGDSAGRILLSAWVITSSTAIIGVFIIRFVHWIKGLRHTKILEVTNESKEGEDEQI